MVIGAGSWEVIVRFKSGAFELAYECVAGERESETVIFGFDCLSISLLCSIGVKADLDDMVSMMEIF